MLDKTSFKFIMGFVGILIISFIVFAGSVYFKTSDNEASVDMVRN